MTVYYCFETSTVFGTFWLFLSVPLVAVWTFWLSRASLLGCLFNSVTDRTALDVLPQFSGSRHSTRSFCHTFCNRCLFPEFLKLQTLLRVTSLHLNTLLLDLWYGDVDARHCNAGSPPQFPFESAELIRQYSAHLLRAKILLVVTSNC